MSDPSASRSGPAPWRDVADGDSVGWIDSQLGAVNSQSPDRLAALREAIIGPLRNVYGVSDKVLAMALSSLLLSAGQATAAMV